MAQNGIKKFPKVPNIATKFKIKMKKCQKWLKLAKKCQKVKKGKRVQQQKKS